MQVGCQRRRETDAFLKARACCRATGAIQEHSDIDIAIGMRTAFGMSTE